MYQFCPDSMTLIVSFNESNTVCNLNPPNLNLNWSVHNHCSPNLNSIRFLTSWNHIPYSDWTLVSHLLHSQSVHTHLTWNSSGSRTDSSSLITPEKNSERDREYIYFNRLTLGTFHHLPCLVGSLSLNNDRPSEQSSIVSYPYIGAFSTRDSDRPAVNWLLERLPEAGGPYLNKVDKNLIPCLQLILTLFPPSQVTTMMPSRVSTWSTCWDPQDIVWTPSSALFSVLWQPVIASGRGEYPGRQEHTGVLCLLTEHSVLGPQGLGSHGSDSRTKPPEIKPSPTDQED